MTEQTLSAERREEVRELWFEVGCGDKSWDKDSFWAFIAALDAQSAERTRAEVEKMREMAAMLAVETLSEEQIYQMTEGIGSVLLSPIDAYRLGQKTSATRIRAIPIEGTSR